MSLDTETKDQQQQQEGKYLKMYHGIATDELVLADMNTARVDRKTDTAVISTENMEIFLNKYSSLGRNISVGALKLLDYAIIRYTQGTHYKRTTAPENAADLVNQITFSLEEYGTLKGLQMYPQLPADADPEELEKEKRKIKSNLDQLRPKLKKDLQILRAISLTWEETKGKGKHKETTSYENICICSSASFRLKTIKIGIGPEFANYLSHSCITRYPTNIFILNEKSPYAYQIGRKIAIYYGIPANHAKGQANKLKVSNLLKASGIITYDELSTTSDKGHWGKRIKKPFEKALDELISIGFLEEWHYVTATDKGKSYKDFIDCYVQFTVKCYPEIRIKRKDKEGPLTDCGN